MTHDTESKREKNPFVNQKWKLVSLLSTLKSIYTLHIICIQNRSYRSIASIHGEKATHKRPNAAN